MTGIHKVIFEYDFLLKIVAFYFHKLKIRKKKKFGFLRHIFRGYSVSFH